MSHYRIKTTYNEEGNYGSIDKKTAYAHHNLSCDYVTFFDDDGNVIMSIPDTIDNNLLDAINRLYNGINGAELSENVEAMNKEDMDKIKE